jgi:Tfp pilus assembly protein PilN
MIEINLLPGARKSKRSRSTSVDFGAFFGDFSSRIRDPYLIGAIASVLIAALAVGGLYLRQSSRIKQLGEREQQAVQDSTRYTAVIAQRSAAEASRDSVVRQINIIRAIDGTRFVWPHILDEISRTLPPYTWLVSIAQTSAVPSISPDAGADAKGKSKLAAEADSAAASAGRLAFRIVGTTVDIQALTRFMKQLEASAWIENVQLVKTEIIVVQPMNKEATSFTLDMKLQTPDSTHIRRVPISIAVR